jgi:hypothetical protein
LNFIAGRALKDARPVFVVYTFTFSSCPSRQGHFFSFSSSDSATFHGVLPSASKLFFDYWLWVPEDYNSVQESVIIFY